MFSRAFDSILSQCERIDNTGFEMGSDVIIKTAYIFLSLIGWHLKTTVFVLIDGVLEI